MRWLRTGWPIHVIGLTLVLAGVAALLTGDPGAPLRPASTSTTLVAVFTAAIVVGEWFQLPGSSLRGSAPIATAAALGFVFTIGFPGGPQVLDGLVFALAVTGIAMTTVAWLSHLTGRAVSMIEAAGRFVAIAVAAGLTGGFRIWQLGVDGAHARVELEPWQQAAVMLTIAVLGLLVDVVFTSVMRRVVRATRRKTLKDELRSSFALSAALAVTGVLIAVAVPPLGPSAVPLFLTPLVLTLFAFRRYVGIRATYLQSIRTLARLTDAAGYTPRGHSERVAALAVAVGRELGLAERELLDLEYAALLHDIGQVALVDPIPGGATVLAAPADQRRIGADTVAIVRETGVLDDVAQILEHQMTPFRQLRELGEEIPLPSRIIKVVNAYEDLAGPGAPRGARETAIERMYLGLGYEYDPYVVEALTRVLRAPASSR